MDKMTLKPTAIGFFLKHYYVLLLALPAVLLLFIISLAGIFTLESWMMVILLIALAVLASVALAHSKIHQSVTSVYANEEKFVHETGILHHKKMKIPMHMITDTSIKRTLYDRIIGTATLEVSTSGSAGIEVTVSCLPHSETEVFHENLYAIISKNQAKLRTEPSQNSPLERP